MRVRDSMTQSNEDTALCVYTHSSTKFSKFSMHMLDLDLSLARIPYFVRIPHLATLGYPPLRIESLSPHPFFASD